MKYKLYNEKNINLTNPQYTVLSNRGIENVKDYLNLTDEHLYHYSLLSNINEAKDCLIKHIESKNHIHIIVDPDCDGICSAAIMYKYLKLLDEEVNLTYSLHEGKQHGISSDIIIPDGIKLLIIPDASTNDIEQCKNLKKKGIDIIILDHHEQEKKNTHAIIVNPQICDYPNKNICGTAVVYKFLQALDEDTWNDYANNFIDLVALGLIGDAMDIRSFETKKLIDVGIKKIQNKAFKALTEKQAYSMSNTVNIINIQFYIVPLINAMIRSGSTEEKDLMFRAFIETDEVFKYKPRRKSKNDPEPEEIDENIYTRVARLCSNAKQRQNNTKDKSLDEISQIIEDKGLNKNKILFVNVTDILDKNLTGVVAMQTVNKFNKPCLMLRKTHDDLYEGSARNLDGCELNDLKGFLEKTGYFKYLLGHPNAFGVGIKKENIKLVIEKTNELLQNVDFSFAYIVDFILDSSELTVSFVKDMDELIDFYGQGIKESMIVVKDIHINLSDIQLMGKESNTWKYILNDEVTLIKFKCDENDEVMKLINNSWGEDCPDSIIINIVGKPCISSYGGIMTSQVTIEDYEIRKD